MRLFLSKCPNCLNFAADCNGLKQTIEVQCGTSNYEQQTRTKTMNIVRKEIQLPDGRTITLETGKLAKQADGAVMATLGNTMILATVIYYQIFTIHL